MSECKHCFAKEILGSRINKVWLVRCEKRKEEKICCRKCSLLPSCPLKCNRTSGDCCYYVKESEIERMRLAREIDPSNDYWNHGRPFPKMG